MSLEQNRQVMTAFRDALLERGAYDQFFADNVTVDWMGYGRQADSREGARKFIDYFQTVAFEANLFVKAIVVGENEAFAEAIFDGRHVGEFIGVQPTGRHVNVPYCVAYSLLDGEITALRIYFAADVLLSQLRADLAAAS
jgi:predicted ester cyclase